MLRAKSSTLKKPKRIRINRWVVIGLSLQLFGFLTTTFGVVSVSHEIFYHYSISIVIIGLGLIIIIIGYYTHRKGTWIGDDEYNDELDIYLDEVNKYKISHQLQKNGIVNDFGIKNIPKAYIYAAELQNMPIIPKDREMKFCKNCGYSNPNNQLICECCHQKTV